MGNRPAVTRLQRSFSPAGRHRAGDSRFASIGIKLFPLSLLRPYMAFDAFALILAMLALGWLMARFRVMPASAAETLNLVVLYVCFPAAVLIYVPRLHLDMSLLGLVATPWLITAATVPVVLLCKRWLRFGREEFAVLLLCVSLGNTGFIGYPMTRALLGEQALPYAVMYDQLGTFILLSTFGLYVLARYSGDTPPGPRQILARIARFPPVWALLFAFFVMPENPPEWIASGLQRLSDAMLPLVMLAVGLTIQFNLPRSDIKPLATGIVLKLVVMPALALGLSLLFGMHDQMLEVNVLETAMPSMITAAALAISHQLAPRLAAALVGYSILFSLITLPAWMGLLRHIV